MAFLWNSWNALMRMCRRRKKKWCFLYMGVGPFQLLSIPTQGRSRRSGWSGFGQTTIFQGKNEIPFFRKQVINKSTRVIFGLVQLVVLRYSRQKKDMIRWKIISRPRMQKQFMQHKVYYCAKLSNKQSAKVICRFDRLRKHYTARDRKSYMSIEKLSSTHTFNYIVLRVKHGLTSCKDFATALQLA